MAKFGRFIKFIGNDIVCIIIIRKLLHYPKMLIKNLQIFDIHKAIILNKFELNTGIYDIKINPSALVFSTM